MIAPLSLPDSRFRWHPRATAFAGDTQIRPTACPPQRLIPPRPLNACLTALGATLGTGQPFCITETTPDGLATLPADHFATLTGGTSGAPKAILRSQPSWTRSFATNAALFAYTAQDSIAVLGALTHSLALYGVLEGLHLGLDVHGLCDMSPAAQAAQLRTAGCTILYATPTQLRLIARAAPLPRLRLILCGGGALDARTRAQVAALCPNAALHVFYGAAESSFIALGTADTPAGSVGRAYPQVEITVRDARGKPTSGSGTIWVRSPYLFLRYLHGNSAHTRREGAYLTVGEQGYVDTQGNLFLQGRAGRMVTIADQNVFLEEVEAHLMALEAFEHCAVLALPDPLRGHHLVAAICGAADPALATRIKIHCRTALGTHTTPRAVHFLDPFPLLASGKPDLARIATIIEAAP